MQYVVDMAKVYELARATAKVILRTHLLFQEPSLVEDLVVFMVSGEPTAIDYLTPEDLADQWAEYNGIKR
jgi:hypothetical protein